MNLLEARIEADGAAGGLVVTCNAALRLPLSARSDSALGAYRDRAVILGIRPEDLREARARCRGCSRSICRWSRSRRSGPK